MDERELIDAAQGGDRSAFEVLVKQTYADTYTLAYRLTGNEEDARDVAKAVHVTKHYDLAEFGGEIVDCGREPVEQFGRFLLSDRIRVVPRLRRLTDVIE